MAKYVVLGATGQTGAAMTAALVERATVRVAVRSEDKGAVSDRLQPTLRFGLPAGELNRWVAIS